MAKKKTKSKTTKTPRTKKASFALSNQQRLIFGSLLIILGLLLFISFLSFFFTGEADQSALNEFASRAIKTENWASKFGAWLSDFFIQRGFGIASFIFSGLLFLSGVYLLTGVNKVRLRKHWFWGTLIVIWLSIFFGFFAKANSILGGTIGFEINSFLQDYIGKIGVIALLVLGLITYLAVRFKVTPDSIGKLFKSAKKEIKDDFKNNETLIQVDNSLSTEAENIKSTFEIPLKEDEQTIKTPSTIKDTKDNFKIEVAPEEIEDLEMKIETVTEEKSDA